MIKDVDWTFPKPKMTSSNVLCCPQLKDSSDSSVCHHIGGEKTANIHIQEDLEKVLKLLNQLLKKLVNYLIAHNTLQFYK